MEPFWAVVMGIVASALFSGLAAFFGTWLNRNRYYQEKWWDRKVDTYSQVIEALSNLNSMFLRVEGYEQAEHITSDSLQIVPDKWDCSRLQQWHEQEAVVARAINLGGFIVSRDASEVLGKFIKDWDDFRDFCQSDEHDLEWFEINNSFRKMSKECLEKITRIAKEDLEGTS